MEKYYLKPSDLLLSYTEFKKLIKKVRDTLSENDLSWLAEWDLLDLALSPMDDDERRFMRNGHYLGWSAFQQKRAADGLVCCACGNEVKPSEIVCEVCRR